MSTKQPMTTREALLWAALFFASLILFGIALRWASL